MKAVNWESLGLEIIRMIKALAEKAVGWKCLGVRKALRLGGLVLGIFEVGKVFGRERCELVKTRDWKGLC